MCFVLFLLPLYQNRTLLASGISCCFIKFCDISSIQSCSPQFILSIYSVLRHQRHRFGLRVWSCTKAKYMYTRVCAVLLPQTLKMGSINVFFWLPYAFVVTEPFSWFLKAIPLYRLRFRLLKQRTGVHTFCPNKNATSLDITTSIERDGKILKCCRILFIANAALELAFERFNFFVNDGIAVVIRKYCNSLRPYAFTYNRDVGTRRS